MKMQKKKWFLPIFWLLFLLVACSQLAACGQKRQGSSTLTQSNVLEKEESKADISEKERTKENGESHIKESLEKESLPTEDTYWRACEWRTEFEEGKEDVLLLPSETWMLDMVFYTDGTARFRDIQGDFYLLDESSLYLEWYQDEEGIIWFYTENYLEPFCYGIIEGEVFTLQYMGSDLIMEQFPMPQDVGEVFLPAELVGTWLMVSGETEGWEWEAMPGQLETLLFKTTWTAEAPSLVADREILNHYGNLEKAFYDQELTLLNEPLYVGCGNETWSVRIGPEYAKDENGCPEDTECYVTLLDRDRLLMQRYFALDGVPMVTYQTYRRIPPMLTWWDLKVAELAGTYWECASYWKADGTEMRMPPGFDDLYLFLEEGGVCMLGQLQTGSKNYTDTQGIWILGSGGTVLVSGEGYESPEGDCPEFWYGGAACAWLIETEEGFEEHYHMYLYYDGGLIDMVRKDSMK